MHYITRLSRPGITFLLCRVIHKDMASPTDRQTGRAFIKSLGDFSVPDFCRIFRDHLPQVVSLKEDRKSKAKDVRKNKVRFLTRNWISWTQYNDSLCSSAVNLPCIGDRLCVDMIANFIMAIVVKIWDLLLENSSFFIYIYLILFFSKT